jgi:prepilin-type processing-associated H-X9-DG protein
MPYLEEANLIQGLDFDEDVIAQFNSEDSVIRSIPLRVLRCPSDTYPSVSNDPTKIDGHPVGPHAVTNYAPSIGAQATFSWLDACPEPVGNEFGNGDDLHKFTYLSEATSGLFSRIIFAASMRQILDGTSKTIAMGEVLPDCNYELIRFGWWDSQIYYVGTAPPINYDSCTPTEPAWPTRNTCAQFFNWNTSAGFKSRHPGGAQFVFADGAVHFIDENIDYHNYQRLGDRRDGEPIEPF